MRDPQVELLFRIAVTAFAARNFKHDGVANLNLGIRFDNEVARHFFPECWDAAWHAQLIDFSRRIGLDSVALMRSAHGFVSNTDIYDNDRVKPSPLTSPAAWRADLTFISECKALRRELESRVLTRAGTRLRRTYARGMPVWAAESLRLGNCWSRAFHGSSARTERSGSEVSMDIKEQAKKVAAGAGVACHNGSVQLQ
jgi:hypothetical protein